MKGVPFLVVAFVAFFASLACGLSPASATVVPTVAPPVGPTVAAPLATESPIARATAVAPEPAAGICAEPTDDEVVMRLEPGIPDPRCIIVRAGQRLRVVNHTGGDVTVSLGPFSLLLPSNGETVIGPTFGEYLLPGVHSLQVDPCCGGELWLKE